MQKESEKTLDETVICSLYLLVPDAYNSLP